VAVPGATQDNGSDSIRSFKRAPLWIHKLSSHRRTSFIPFPQTSTSFDSVQAILCASVYLCTPSRRQPALPTQPHPSATSSRSAIPPLQHKPIFNNPSQDVRSSVNASASSRNPAPATRHLRNNSETSVSTPATHNELTARIYSTPVCHTIQDLAAHHGIPQILPPAPRPRTSQNTAPASPLNDFSALKNSYLSMLSQTPQESETGLVDTVSPSDLQTTGTEANAALETMFASPQELAAALASFMTPLETPLQDFESSPFDSPFDDFLTTPVIGDADDAHMLTSPLFDDGQSFFELMDAEPLSKAQHELELYTISPMTTPALDFIDPSSIYPSPQIAAPHGTPSSSHLPLSSPVKPVSSSRRKTSATGTRKGLTVNAMVPLDAPTQPRNYLSASSTSRKEVPAVIARKRARSQALGDDDDESRDPPPPPTASEKEQIEWKRRQNTLAARKSRQRKVMYLQELETKLEEATREAEKWKVRSQMLSHTLSTHNIPVPRFDGEE